MDAVSIARRADLAVHCPVVRFPRARPGFLVVMTATAALVVSLTGLLGETALNKRALAEYRQALAVQERLEVAASRGWVEWEDPDVNRFAESTGVRALLATRSFRVNLSEGDLSGAPAGTERDRVVAVLEHELSRYPAGFLHAAGLRFVLLCSELRQEGRPIPSLPNFESTLVLDVTGEVAFFRRLIHHEVFHFIDFADDHQLKMDERWSQLNDRFFAYGNGGRFVRNPRASELGSGLPGFLSAYSMSALEEDKAELFSFLMAEPTAAQRLVARDPILQGKQDALRAQLQRFTGSERPLFEP